jgi:hypothetical protein
LTALGFLSIVDRPGFGAVGGYLLVTTRGRPLEFHCSEPVLPNRAQEILYGPTLRPFVYGELIGRALVDHAKLSVSAILVESPDALAVRESIDVPVAAVASRHTVNPGESPLAGLPADDLPLAVGAYLLTPAAGHSSDFAILRDVLVPLAGEFDLCEPFERIRLAIDEAQRKSA